MEKHIAKKISRRLLPLYIATFFHGFVLWYAIEKLFMHQIGFDDAGIGLMIAAYSALMLLAETPSGILADRWSRKGVLMLASIMLAVASLVCGLSTEPGLYIAGALVWGLFFSLYSGTYDSIIYDTVKEITGKGDLYDTFFGRYRAIDSAALVAGALMGGALGQWLGLPATYFMTFPLALGAIVALWLFKEPQLHKEDQREKVVAHIQETFKMVLGRPVLLPLVALIVMLFLGTIMIYEFNQLWFIALQLSPLWFGLAISASMAASGVAGYFVGRIPGRNKPVRIGLHLALIASTGMLIFVRMTPVIVAAQFVYAACIVALIILNTRDLHDVLPSRVRAGASSALSTMARMLVIPTGLLFGALSTSIDVFAASWVLTVLTVVALGLQLSRADEIKIHGAPG